MEIYVYIIFLQNIIINFIILWATSKISDVETTFFRIFLSSMAGAFYAILFLIIHNLPIYSALWKFVFSIIMVYIAFRPRRIKYFIRIICVFYLTTFLFAGAAFALLYLIQGEGFIQNGIIYVFWETKLTVLVLSILLVLIMIKIIRNIIKYRLNKENLYVPVRISFENESICISALIDTGNSLYDPITRKPVIIVEFKALKKLLPQEIRKMFDSCEDKDLVGLTDIVSGSKWAQRFRLIPFRSLGRENGMLVGFKPDLVEIGENLDKNKMKNVVVGIYNRTFSKADKYSALLNRELILK